MTRKCKENIASTLMATAVVIALFVSVAHGQTISTTPATAQTHWATLDECGQAFRTGAPSYIPDPRSFKISPGESVRPLRADEAGCRKMKIAGGEVVWYISRAGDKSVVDAADKPIKHGICGNAFLGFMPFPAPAPSVAGAPAPPTPPAPPVFQLQQQQQQVIPPASYQQPVQQQLVYQPQPAQKNCFELGWGFIDTCPRYYNQAPPPGYGEGYGTYFIGVGLVPYQSQGGNTTVVKITNTNVANVSTPRGNGNGNNNGRPYQHPGYGNRPYFRPNPATSPGYIGTGGNRSTQTQRVAAPASRGAVTSGRK